MYRPDSRAVRMTLGVMLTALTACMEEPSPSEVGPDFQPRFGVGDVITVTNTSGGTDIGSLRWAVSGITGGEVIRFDPGLAGQTITVDTTVIISKHVTIEGPADEGITISGGGKVRVFQFSHSLGEAVLRNLTIAHGNRDANGNGGGTAGGIEALSYPLRVENSTLTGNVAGAYPALFASNVTLVNTTVSGNTATNSSFPYPAISASSLTLDNSTIAHNASAGVYSGNLLLRNSIISNHSGKPNCQTGGTSITRQGGNIADDDTCGSPLDIMVANPQLGPLADNGGPTATHALATGSPAINGGASCTVDVDQRYAARDAQCDVGAFEFTDFTTVDLTLAASASLDRNARALVTGTVRCSRDETFDLHIELQQTQKSGRGTIDMHAAATTPIACGTSVQSWSVALGGPDERFVVGGAVATAGTLNSEPWVWPASISRSVELVKSKK